MAACRKVSVCMPSGQEIEVDLDQSATIQTLKEQLQVKVGSCPAGMRLLCGDLVLEDGWKLEDKVSEDSTLTLVMSSVPAGTFTYSSLSNEESTGPAGLNTSADVQAEFFSDGRFNITIQETEITSDYEDEEYDPYESAAAWDHEYTGTITAIGQELRLAIADFKRKGRFDNQPDVELQGTWEGFTQLKLQLPFAAGGCNEGTAGLRWLSLTK